MQNVSRIEPWRQFISFELTIHMFSKDKTESVCDTFSCQKPKSGKNPVPKMRAKQPAVTGMHKLADDILYETLITPPPGERHTNVIS